ncbi:hypothetical protein Micbo1qcDRAFT_162003 [Microdochium bolleyi]|uniref:Glycoside hydrolase/deacetylase n=1 Tax=Microdochium bolleyi TaxID=196109 RepID=A0A136J4N9_9PEZI|nr:hypothetical protein Micbo1qcDRAFT_162003 [Microdochium bolleyi]
MHINNLMPLLLAGSLTAVSASALPPLLSNRAVSPDNTCGNTGAGANKGYTCPAGGDFRCCSQYGWCGASSDHCGTGCQSGFGSCGTSAPAPVVVSPDNTCGNIGAGTKGYTCPSGGDFRCCSMYGWCGASSDHCGTGCQSGFGTCGTGTGGGGGDGGGSSDGRCGANFGNKKCAADECCSLSGYCGKSDEHCMAPDCQFAFGPACDANLVPSGASTSNIARPQLGNVIVGGEGIYPCVNKGQVALTFDDGPGDFTAGMLDLLKRYNAKATFFITGVNNNKGKIDDPSTPWPAIIRRMNTDGHQLASHTWSHADLSAITSAQRRDEMVKLEMAMRNIVGFIPTYMRPPYSSCTAASGCQADMAALKYHVTYFDLDTSDYLNTLPSQIQNAKNKFDQFFVGKVPASSNALAIAHDIHQQTAQNLTEYMLLGLQRRGYQAVTVGTCLGDPKANWYRTNV